MSDRESDARLALILVLSVASALLAIGLTAAACVALAHCRARRRAAQPLATTAVHVEPLASPRERERERARRDARAGGGGGGGGGVGGDNNDDEGGDATSSSAASAAEESRSAGDGGADSSDAIASDGDGSGGSSSSSLRVLATGGGARDNASTSYASAASSSEGTRRQRAADAEVAALLSGGNSSIGSSALTTDGGSTGYAASTAAGTGTSAGMGTSRRGSARSTLVRSSTDHVHPSHAPAETNLGLERSPSVPKSLSQYAKLKARVHRERAMRTLSPTPQLNADAAQLSSPRSGSGGAGAGSGGAGSGGGFAPLAVSATPAMWPATDSTLSESDELVELDRSAIELGPEVGHGAFARVYMGKYRQEIVAIKELLSESFVGSVHDNLVTADERERARRVFMQEMELMRHLKPHPHVVLLRGVCTRGDGPPWIVTEFCPGGALLGYLRELRESNQRLGRRQRVGMMLQAARGVLHLHEQRIVHRDIAARNMLLDEVGSIKVADFGLSRLTDDEGQHQTRSRTGPLRWMAPESLVHKHYCTPTRDGQLLTNRGFLFFDDVLRLVDAVRDAAGELVVERGALRVRDWRGLRFASYDASRDALVYEQPVALAYNPPASNAGDDGYALVEFTSSSAAARWSNEANAYGSTRIVATPSNAKIAPTTHTVDAHTREPMYIDDEFSDSALNRRRDIDNSSERDNGIVVDNHNKTDTNTATNCGDNIDDESVDDDNDDDIDDDDIDDDDISVVVTANHDMFVCDDDDSFAHTDADNHINNNYNYNMNSNIYNNIINSNNYNNNTKKNDSKGNVFCKRSAGSVVDSGAAVRFLACAGAGFVQKTAQGRSCATNEPMLVDETVCGANASSGSAWPPRRPKPSADECRCTDTLANAVCGAAPCALCCASAHNAACGAPLWTLCERCVPGVGCDAPATSARAPPAVPTPLHAPLPRFAAATCIPSLHTAIERGAFLELYGFWLGACGATLQALDTDTPCVAFDGLALPELAFVASRLRALGLCAARDWRVDAALSDKRASVPAFNVRVFGSAPFVDFFLFEYAHAFTDRVDSLFEKRLAMKQHQHRHQHPHPHQHPHQQSLHEHYTESCNSDELARLARESDDCTADVPSCVRSRAARIAARQFDDVSSADGSLLAPEYVRGAKWCARWVWCVPRDAARAVLAGVLAASSSGDGRRTRRQHVATTPSVRFRDELVRLALHAGSSARFWLRRGAPTARDEWALAIGSSGRATRRVAASEMRRLDGEEMREQADGRAAGERTRQRANESVASDARRAAVAARGATWCATMPSGFVVMRRARRATRKSALHAEDGGRAVVLSASRPTVQGNSFKSDLYSFGILMWEIETRGLTPYFHMRQQLKLVMQIVRDHVRPPAPALCPLVLVQLMERCWQHDPDHRPDMRSVVSLLQDLQQEVSDQYLTEQSSVASLGTGTLSTINVTNYDEVAGTLGSTMSVANFAPSALRANEAAMAAASAGSRGNVGSPFGTVSAPQTASTMQARELDQDGGYYVSENDVRELERAYSAKREKRSEASTSEAVVVHHPSCVEQMGGAGSDDDDELVVVPTSLEDEFTGTLELLKEKLKDADIELSTNSGKSK